MLSVSFLTKGIVLLAPGFIAEMNFWMAVGFLLAAYSVVANDSLQTLGTFIASNKGRTPKLVQMAFICGVTTIVL